MNLYDLVTSEITARQAGQLYGLRFARNGRAFCPWHDDGKHPALGFFDDDKRCHCFVCDKGGNAIGLTAQILGISNYEAARQLQKDFHLSESYEYRAKPSTTLKAKERREYEERQEIYKRWNHLCDVVNEANERLKNLEFKSGKEFDRYLDVMCMANHELDYIWEVIIPTL